MRFSILFIFMAMVSCQEIKTLESSNEYSGLFHVNMEGKQTRVRTIDEFGAVITEVSFLEPYKRIVVLSTTYLAYVKALGAEASVAGLVDKSRLEGFYGDDYSLIQDIKSVGSSGVLNTELISSLQPDLIICNSFQQGDLAMFTDVDLLVVNEFWESHPLGRAEWIKVFGVLLGKEDQAEGLFKEVKSSYLKEVNAEHNDLPKVFNLSRFSSTYYLPGCQSLFSKILDDLRCDVSCIEGNSRANEISQEQMLSICGSRDYLVFFDWLPQKRNAEQVLVELGAEDCYEGDLVYCNTSSNSYFESTIMEPHLVMSNLNDVLRRGKKTTKYFTLLTK